MRPTLLLLAAALLAGCAAPDDPLDRASAAHAAASAALPWHSEGEFFMKPSQGGGLAEVELPFLVNATDGEARATVTIGERYGPVELPRSTAYLEARIVDAAGKVAAEARRMPGGEPTLTLSASGLPQGETLLVLGIGGGSDEKANGDYVRYVLDAPSP